MAAPVTRRAVLAGAGSAALGARLAAPAAAQTDLASWFADTSNADRVVDRTGESEVRVAVGSEANGGGFGFAPAAVRVDPGATVRWEWTGEGGGHNVVAEDGTFESALTSEAGHTFEWTAREGVHRYACTPHRGLGMKGAVVAGVEATLGGGSTTPDETATPAPTAGDPDRTFGGWLANTDGFDGVVDRRGRDETVVRVGARGNGGHLAFDPPAVRVDPGTTVVWRWVSDGPTHDVVDSDGLFESPDASAEGTEYAVRFDGHGLSTYACEPHEEAGMRGVVLVGRGEDRRVTPLGFGGVAGLGGLTVAVLLKVMADAAPDRPGD